MTVVPPCCRDGFCVLQQRLKLMAEAAKVPAGAPLRDHRALLCNADDYGRMRAVPKEKGANFRDMPGVVTNEDGEARLAGVCGRCTCNPALCVLLVNCQ